MPGLPLKDRPYLLLTLTSLFWGGNAVVGRAVVDFYPPVALAATRWTIAFLIILPFAWPTIRTELPIIRRHFWMLVLLAASSIGAFNTLLYWSLVHTTAINAGLMQSVGPLLIGLWSFLLFRDPLTPSQVGGILLSFLGIAAIISGGDITRLAQLTLNVGDVAVIVAIGIYGLYTTLLRKRPAMTALSFATVTIGLGALMVIPAALIEYRTGARVTSLGPGILAAILYVSIFPSILSVLCYNRGVALIGANRSGPFLHLVPLFATILAIAFLGERPGLHHAIGAVLIAIGVIVASRRQNATTNRVAASQTQP